MKNILITTAALFLSLTASAHIEPGVYQGKTAEGVTCAMTAGENYFLDDKAHPLNERIEITYENDRYVIQHPPVIDEATATAFFNHDLFHGVLATNTGAKAIVVHMLHAANAEGPVSFTVIDHQWKSGRKTTLACLNLKKQ